MSAPTLVSKFQPPKQANRNIDDYKIPAVQEGDRVLWFETPKEKKGRPAFITEAFEQSCDLAVLIPSATNMLPKIGCRWRQDPRPWPAEAVEDGCWDFAPSATPDGEIIVKTIEKLAEELTALRLRVAALETAKTKG